jgi:hypothetical protein
MLVTPVQKLEGWKIGRLEGWIGPIFQSASLPAF